MSRINIDLDAGSESPERAVDESEVQLEASRTLEIAREAAQGIEVFEDPDATIPRSDLRQGAPGHDSLVADDATDDDEVREGESEERW